MEFKKSPVANSIPFDNSVNGFESFTVQGAIEEIGASASPGLSWGRSGTTGAGTWLQNEGVPSNTTGRFIAFSNAKLSSVFVSNEDISTFTVEVYKHDGAGINLQLVATLNVVATRGTSGSFSVPVEFGKQLAIKIGAGTCKNVVVGAILKGS